MASSASKKLSEANENLPHDKGLVLVTGGAGYVGSVLLPMLLERGYRVRVLDSLVHRQHSLLPHFISKNFEFIRGDVRDKETMEKAVKGADYIVHLAAIVGEPAGQKDPKATYAINLDATKMLNNLRTPDQKILFASTGSVYGKIEGLCTEDTPLNPLSEYAITKMEAEKAIATKDNYIIYRFATAFGLSPRLRLDLLINDFVFRALKHRFNVVYEAHFKRTFIHVYDLARSFLYGIEHFDKMKNDVYNVGAEDMNFTKEEIAKKIKERVPHDLHFSDFGTDRDQRNYEVSYAKVRNKGFGLSVGLDRGLDELVEGCKILYVPNPFSNID